MLRSGSSSLQRLTKMVGKSRQIYKVGCLLLPGCCPAVLLLLSLQLHCCPGFRRHCPGLARHSVPAKAATGSATMPACPPPHPTLPCAAQGIVELCILRYRDSDSLYVGLQEAALCALRSQVSTAQMGASLARRVAGWQD